MKRMRTLLAGDGEVVCSGVGEGVADSSGETEGDGCSSGSGDEVGVGESCASAPEPKIAIVNARTVFVVMSREVETALTVKCDAHPSNIERFLVFASE
jgi:hypothetical protein